MTIKQIAVFLFDFRRGRCNRGCWWIMFAAVIPLLNVAAYFYESQTSSDLTRHSAFVATAFLSWIFWSVGAKRCHDRDKSGWVQLLIIFPILGFFWYLYELGFVRGNPWPNRFGMPTGFQPGKNEEV